MRLGGLEAGVQAVRPDGAVAGERRGAGGRHGPVDLRGEARRPSGRRSRAPAGRRSAPARPAGPCPAPRPAAGTWGMWTCVSTRPGMTTSGRRSIGSAAGWSAAAWRRACRRARAVGGRTDGRKPTRGVHLDQAVGLPQQGAIGQRREQPCAQAEGRSIRERDWHGGERRLPPPRRQTAGVGSTEWSAGPRYRPRSSATTSRPSMPAKSCGLQV